jgi:two-component system LytT family response regulator
MKLNCIAIDDEPLALKQVAGFIEKTPFLSLAGSCKSAFDAMEILTNNKIDLMFVDIQMPDLSGLDFVKSWGENQKIIFTTAFEEYALDGFKVDAIDYLLKPFGYEEFLKAAKKAASYFELLERAGKKNQKVEEYIFVKSEYKLVKISFKDIVYIEALREYIKIVLHNDKPVHTLQSIKSIEEKLPGNFMRVHRSFIVNLDYVKLIEKGRIIFDKVYIPVSEQYKTDFQNYIEKGMKGLLTQNNIFNKTV